MMMMGIFFTTLFGNLALCIGKPDVVLVLLSFSTNMKHYNSQIHGYIKLFKRFYFTSDSFAVIFKVLDAQNFTRCVL